MQSSHKPGTTNVDIYDRIGNTEQRIAGVQAELNALGRNFSNLQETLSGVQSSIQSVEAKLGGVGKISGMQIVTVIGSLVGAVALMAAAVVAPLRVEIAALRTGIEYTNTLGEKAIVDLANRLYNHGQEPSHRSAGEQLVRLDEKVKANAGRLDELDIKLQMEMKGADNLADQKIDAMGAQVRAETESAINAAWVKLYEGRISEMLRGQP